MSDLAELIKEHVDWQEKCGWHHDWPEALTAIRAVLELHKPVEIEVTTAACLAGDCEHELCHRAMITCDHCSTLASVWADSVPVEVWPCPTVGAVAGALGVREEGA